MTDRQKKSRGRLLATLLAMLLLLTLLAMPAFAEGVEEEGFGESSSFAESTSDSSLIEPEDDTSEPEESEVEDASDAADEAELEEEPRASAAGASLLDVLPVQVLDYAGFDTALAQIILDGDGHIELLNDIILPDTVVVPDGVSLTITGATGDESIVMATGVDNTRHFWVEGELLLADVNIYGELRGGGIVVVESGRIELHSGARIWHCKRVDADSLGSTNRDRYGGGALMLRDDAEGIMYDGAELYQNMFVNTTSQVYAGGGAVAVMDFNSHFIMEGGSIVGNAAGDSANQNWANMGGAVLVYVGRFTMNDGLIQDNLSYDAGGAVSLMGYSTSQPAYFTMNGGRLENNFARLEGGAIFSYRFADIYMGPGTEGVKNECYYDGGFLSAAGQDIIIIDGANISYNTSSYSGDGGALYIWRSPMSITITDTLFHGNSATGNGGAVYTSNPNTISFNGCIFTKNTAELEGGAIYIDDYYYINQNNLNRFENLTVHNSNFSNNYSALGPYEFVPGDTDFETLHNTNTSVTGLSSPFDHTWSVEPRYNKVYNNFDISYPNGTPFSVYEVEFYVEGIVAPVGSEFSIDGQPVREYTGYTPPAGQMVDGWYTDTTYATKWVFTDSVSGNMELYGRLAPLPGIDYTLTVEYYFGFDLATGTYIDETDYTIPDGDDPTGYLPSSWLDTHRPTIGYAAGILTEPLALPGAIDADTILKVLYTPNEYYVTFDFSQVFNAPNDVEVVEVYYNELVPVQDTTKSGYTFNGWWYEAGNRYWSFDTDRMPAGNITLVGRWTKDTNSGSSSTPPPVTPSESSSTGGGGGTTPPAASSSSAPISSMPVSSASTASSSTVSSSSEASSSATSSAAVSEPPEVSSTQEDDYDNRNMEGTDVPLNWWQRGDGWSLLNLIVSILLLLSAAFQLVRVILAKNRREDEYGNESVRQKRRLWTILSAITGILPIILLFILEDFSGAMLMLDKWTPWFIGFAVLHAAFTVVAVTLKSRWKQTE